MKHDHFFLDLPSYNAKVDYQYQYHKLFQDNECKLQKYDKLLATRDREIGIYMAMKKGDFSHMNLPPHGPLQIYKEKMLAEASQRKALFSVVPHFLGKRAFNKGTDFFENDGMEDGEDGRAYKRARHGDEDCSDKDMVSEEEEPHTQQNFNESKSDNFASQKHHLANKVIYHNNDSCQKSEQVNSEHQGSGFSDMQDLKY